MAKNDDNSNTVLSISKSQKNKAAKLAKMKGKMPAIHGGVCSSCGQESATCTPGTHHDGCRGFFEGEFGDVVLDAAQRHHHMLFDGTFILSPEAGSWRSKEAVERVRSENRLEWRQRLASKVILTSVFGGMVTKVGEDADGKFEYEAPEFIRIDAVNGLGEALNYVFGAWCTEDEEVQKRLELEAEELDKEAAASDAREASVRAIVNEVWSDEIGEALRSFDRTLVLDVPSGAGKAEPELTTIHLPSLASQQEASAF